MTPTMNLHTLQKLDDDLTTGSNQDLAFPSFFGICDCFETIGKDGHAHHLQKEIDETNECEVRTMINKGMNQQLQARTPSWRKTFYRRFQPFKRCYIFVTTIRLRRNLVAEQTAIKDSHSQ